MCVVDGPSLGVAERLKGEQEGLEGGGGAARLVWMQGAREAAVGLVGRVWRKEWGWDRVL